MNKNFRIGQVAEVTGIPPKTIRYYEEVGVLPQARRNESRYRQYTEEDVRRLEFIRRARLLEMTLPEVRELVGWASSTTCDDFQDRFLEVVRLKVDEVDKRIVELQYLRGDLQRLEAHLTEAGKEEMADHTMLECSPETCTCLGVTRREDEKR